MAKPIFVGPEFLVNTTTFGQQSDANIAILADGRIVITWTDYSATGDDTSRSAIRAQVLNDDGTPAGAEFLVNTSTAFGQRESSITALDDGRFVITWTDASVDLGSNSVIRAQIFGADGTKDGAEIQVSAVTQDTPYNSVTSWLPDGRFVISWSVHELSDPSAARDWLRIQMFDADGSPSGPMFEILALDGSNRRVSDITTLSDGRFLVMWTESSQFGPNPHTEVVARMYHADGTAVGDSFVINTTTVGVQGDARATELTDGRILFTWTDQSRTSGDTSLSIRAQICDADGLKIGSQFLVNTNTLGDQSGASSAALPDGRFVITWADGDIHAQVFNADGSKVGNEFVVNTSTIRNQYSASVVGMADGRFMVTWTDDSHSGNDTSNTAIRAQIFDSGPLLAKMISGHVTIPQTLVESDLISILAGGVLETQDAIAIRSNSPLANKTTVTVAGTVQALAASGHHDAISLTGTRNGLAGSLGGHQVSVAATGSVISATGNGITIAGTKNQITNLGTISGADYGVRSLGGGLTLTNMGQVSGALAAVFTSSGVDKVVNEGTITGMIKLGTGSDLYDGHLGQVTGPVLGDTGNDSLFGGNGTDRLFGGLGDDSLLGGDGADRLVGDAGNDRLSGGDGDDRLVGGLGIDRLNGDLGADAIYGGDDNDLIYGGGGNDLLIGDNGADLLSGGTEDDTLLGLDGNDSLSGDFGNDRLLGGAGNDVEYGGEGADTLVGGGGADQLTGGSGRDVFVFQTTIGTGTEPGTRDTITDFVPGIDVIDLSAIDANGILSGSPDFTYLGAATFTGVAGQLRYSTTDGLLSGDLNGDGTADFTIALTTLPPLTSLDILL